MVLKAKKGSLFFFLSIVVICSSCVSRKYSISDLQGNFISVGKRYSYSLILESNYNFSLSETDFEVTAKCNGKWSIGNKDTLNLICNEEPLLINQLAGGYSCERERKVVILSVKRLKLGHVILKKK